MSFEAVARLLGPADVVDAGPGWAVRPGDGPVIWGRAPAPSGTGLRDAFAYAARREAALRRTKPKKGTVTRWRPPDLGGSPQRNALRAALLGGAIVEIGTSKRLLDDVASAAGVTVASFRPASGGAILARVDSTVLRVGLAGGPGDPAAGAEALASLPPHPAVPRLTGRGLVGDASWSTETLLSGRRPRRVTKTLWDACVDLCAALPRAPAPEAARLDVDAVVEASPAARSALDALPAFGVARHGDLWRPNLLAAGSTLTGVVDWDAWHPAAAPGVDLLNLYATERHGPGIGDAWRAAPWRSADFRSATAAYWRRLEIDPSPDEMEAIAVAWWAGQVAATLRRLPHLASSERWLDANVRIV